VLVVWSLWCGSLCGLGAEGKVKSSRQMRKCGMILSSCHIEYVDSSYASPLNDAPNAR